MYIQAMLHRIRPLLLCSCARSVQIPMQFLSMPYRCDADDQACVTSMFSCMGDVCHCWACLMLLIIFAGQQAVTHASKPSFDRRR